jgi:hypothetical protein
MEATTQYFIKWFFYKQVLEFYRPSKFLCQTSGRQNHWSLKPMQCLPPFASMHLLLTVSRRNSEDCP